MRYPTSLENIVRTATLTATNVVASSAWELISRDADGGGTVELSGAYTGADDAVVDVEVTSNTINGTPQISAPVFSGVGNGTISGISATSGIDAQEFSVTVLDLGTPTRAAFAPFQSGNLFARTTGTAGNDYTVEISQAGLTATATDYAVTRELGVGGEEFLGEEYNFGATNIEPEGTVPASAPRLRFGDDVTVYRHWREFRDSRYRYHFSPAIQRAVPIGTRVYAITGGRTVTVLDGGVVTETYNTITTLYSLVSALEAGSALIDYDGVIAADRRPGGMACDDLSVYTASYSAGSVRDGSLFIRRALLPLTVPSSAPTETLRIECEAAPIPGAEIWRVIGSVSDDLGTVVTGEAFSNVYGFTMPIELQAASEPEGDRAAWLDLITRTAGVSIPSLCARNFRLGAESRSNTYIFEWRPRPGETCDCTAEPISGGPNDDYLGIEEEGGAAMATLHAALKTRIAAVNEWQRASLGSNIGFSTAENMLREAIKETFTITETTFASILTGFREQASATLLYDEMDVAAIRTTARLLKTHLKQIHADLNEPDTLPTAVADAFDAQLTFLSAWMESLSLSGSMGASAWNSAVFTAFNARTGSSGNNELLNAEEAGVYIAQQMAESRNRITDIAPVVYMCEARIALIYEAADLVDPFDGAARTGNGVWQDHGGTHWFVSQDGLLPLQPGHYYHSAKMVLNPTTGREEPTSTREFGIGVAIGCPELLQAGDKLYIRTTPYSNGRSTYLQGDVIEWQIIRADPVALGGGQVGDDTITFGVRGSVVGALADYELVTTAPASYSNGGLSLTVTPGAIEFEPGDSWTFSAEGGEFRWRIDGGSWTTTDIASTVSLTSGINAVFRVGATPSFVDGDTYQLSALASNGAGRVRRPDDEALTWTGALQLDITPGDDDTADTLMIGSHTIPSTATITISGSNDNWSTTAFSAVLPWRANNIGYLFTAATTCAKWRLAVTESGSIDWLYLGQPPRLMINGAVVEKGRWEQRVRLATGQRTRGLGGRVTHTVCTSESVDDLLTALEYAHTYDDARIGAVSTQSEAGIFTIPQEIEVSDVHGYQPTASARRLSLTMELTPI